MWGDPGVSQEVLIQDANIMYPGASGGPVTINVQRAGLLKRLRLLSTAVAVLSANTGTIGISKYGAFGAYVSRIQVNANGQIPLVDLSGFGACIYNEIQNKDGSVLDRGVTLAALNVDDTTALASYSSPGSGSTGTQTAQYPIEFWFALPVNISGVYTELGLWLLQGQAIDLSINVTFNPMYAAAVTPNTLWNAGTGVTLTPTLASSMIQVERELYELPANPKDFPNLTWAHQIVEYTAPFTGNYSNFPVPKAGLLLRAALINLDANGAPVDASDVSTLNFTYGSNTRPISRPGWALTQEYLQDYNRLPPKGLTLLDFYKWGDQGLKLVKNTEQLANLRLETYFTATAAGTQRIILDRLIPVITTQ